VLPFSDCTKDNPAAHTVLNFGYGRSHHWRSSLHDSQRTICRKHRKKKGGACSKGSSIELAAVVSRLYLNIRQCWKTSVLVEHEWGKGFWLEQMKRYDCEVSVQARTGSGGRFGGSATPHGAPDTPTPGSAPGRLLAAGQQAPPNGPPASGSVDRNHGWWRSQKRGRQLPAGAQHSPEGGIQEGRRSSPGQQAGGCAEAEAKTGPTGDSCLA
jgi:hypothetical protein